jgi:acetolactate synthase I/II/III large subunit
MERSTAATDTRTVTGTGGALLIEQLKTAGVEYVFTNPGSTEVGFFDALAGAPTLKHVVGLHEGIVVAMADGYYQASGNPAFVNVHALPGTAQMAGQLYNAHWNEAALVVTAALVDPTVSSDNVILAPRPGFAQVDVIRQFTKLAWEVRNPASIPLALRRAFKLATTPPCGPVYVAFASSALTTPGVTAEVIDQGRFTIPVRLRPDAAQIEQAARWLIDASAPVLLLGPSLRPSGAVPATVALTEALGIPVLDVNGWIFTDSGFPTQHPLSYDGRGPILGMSPGFFQQFDLFVGLGAEDLIPISDDPRASSLSLPRQARRIALGLDTNAMARTQPIDLPIVADIGLAAQDLLDAVTSLVAKERLEKIRRARYDKIAAETAAFRQAIAGQVRANFGKQPMTPDEAGMIINELLDADALTVHENLSADMQSRFGILAAYGEGAKRRMGARGSSLGWGVGAAVGAKLGEPNRQVVLHIGDGSVMYSAAGFWSMARYGTAVLTIVWNNQNYETVRTAYATYQGTIAQTGHYTGMYLGDPEIDFVKLAESQGVVGAKATTPDELRSALRRGIAATRAGEPFLIDMHIARTGPGADSTWHECFRPAPRRERKK